MFLLVSLSFNLIYTCTSFFHFAHAIVIAFGAYFIFLFSILELPFYVSIPIAVILSLLLGSLMEKIIYKPLRERKTNSIVLLLASLGIYIILQNIISMIFGDDTKSIRTWEVKEGIEIWGAYITPVQLVIIATSVVFILAVAGYLWMGKTGKIMRAVACDPELTRLSGVNSNNIIMLSFAIGSGLAGIAGILVALDVDMTPTMGMNLLLMGVVAMIIGGVGSIWGIVLGSLLLAFAQNIGAWYLSSQWQDAITFGILLIFLLFKPEGFFGKKLNKAEV